MCSCTQHAAIIAGFPTCIRRPSAVKRYAPSPMAVGCGYTVQPPSELDRQTDRRFVLIGL